MSHLREQIVGSLELARQPTALSLRLMGLVSHWRAAAQAKSLIWQTSIAPDLPIIAIDPGCGQYSHPWPVAI